MNAAEMKSESLVLGGGCFWCTEAAYELLPGVKAAVSGYAGGRADNATYDEVCSGNTGHAEVVRIDFDPAQVTLETLLDFFWKIHDPTTLNRQGADAGTQYRSVIFYADDAQKKAAEASLARANPGWGGKIVTEISPLAKFYPAEAYHQDYFRNNPHAGYCLQAWGALTDVLAHTAVPACGFLLHAYAGPAELVPTFAKRGAYFSFNGAFLDPKHAKHRETFKAVPLDRLLVETDALAMIPPQVWRTHKLPPAQDGSAVNHPGNIESAYAGLASLLGIPAAELTAQVDANFRRFFVPDHFCSTLP